MKHRENNDVLWETAKSEPNVEPQSLLCELEPLIKEYFVGQVTLDRDAVLYRMPNGQSFRITVNEL